MASTGQALQNSGSMWLKQEQSFLPKITQSTKKQGGEPSQSQIEIEKAEVQMTQNQIQLMKQGARTKNQSGKLVRDGAGQLA